MLQAKPTFLPFSRPSLDDATIDGVTEVLRSGQLASGPQVLAFEEALTSFVSDRRVRVLTSATAAVEVALQLCGIGEGDEVITSAQSFFTVLNMIAKVGARPVFVDCDLITRNIDLAQVQAAITPRTKAIVPTHFPGSIVDLDALYRLAKQHKLRVIEDAALVIGSRWQDVPVGGQGDLVAFSFHPNKNMTSIEGGALVVNDLHEAKLVEKLRFHGIVRLDDGTRDVDYPGGKFNLPDVNAWIGKCQLAKLPAFLEQRRLLVDHYFAHLHTSPRCLLPPEPPTGQHGDYSWNMFWVLLPLEQLTISREQFRSALQARGIGTGISYEALHLSTLGRSFGYSEGAFPNAERIARQTVTLPLFSDMSLSDVERVCDASHDIIAAARA